MLGVLLLCESMSAARHRLSRLRRLRALGHSVRVLREEAKGSISWKIKFRDGQEKDFLSPIRTTPWGSIPPPADYEAPTPEAMKSQQLAHEPDALHIEALPILTPDRTSEGGH